MTSLLDKYFDDAKNANESGAGNNFCPGLFMIKVKNSELEETSNTGSAIWWRTHFEVMHFKGCSHPHYFKNEKGLPDQSVASSEGRYKPGQSVSFVKNYADKRNHGAINSLWVVMLAGLPEMEKLTYEQIKDGMDKKDIRKLFKENAAEGVVLITEVINSGMHKFEGRYTDDFHKHIAWVPLSRYDGPKWWEDNDTNEDL